MVDAYAELSLLGREDGVLLGEELEALLRRGQISLGILIPADFDRRVADQNRSAVHILVDGSDPTILGVANQLPDPQR